MTAVARGRLNRFQQTNIHPGWFSQPRSAVEILALKMGITVSQLVQGFGSSVYDLVEETRVHSRVSETQRFLKYLQEQDARDAAAAEATDQGLAENSNLTLRTVLVWQNVVLEAIYGQGGFSEFVGWYNTDDWGCDEWCGLPNNPDTEDVRLRKFLDVLLSSNLDDYDFERFYLDADYFASSDLE